MDDARTRDFLGGVPIAVDPTAIEHVLRTLWSDSGSDDGPRVSRLTLGTVVMVADADEASDLKAVCRELAAAHPSRVVIFLRENGAAAVVARVAAMCHLPEPGRPPVCSEVIVLRGGEAALERLPGLVLPLLLPDVPATLWWRSKAVPSPLAARELAAGMERCLTQLAAHPAPAELWRALAPARHHVTDLDWWALVAWREGTAQLFDGHDAAVPAGLDTVTVRGAKGSRGPEGSHAAALLAGWAAGRLGWRPVERHGPQSHWHRPDGAAATLRLEVADDGRLDLRLADSTADAEWLVERAAHPRDCLRLTAHAAAFCQLPVLVPAPRPSHVACVLSALSAPPHTPVRAQAQVYAAWLLGYTVDHAVH
jgi:glucose-6-phosphate dehydrogenase assembly protein OpcA